MIEVECPACGCTCYLETVDSVGGCHCSEDVAIFVDDERREKMATEKKIGEWLGNDRWLDDRTDETMERARQLGAELRSRRIRICLLAVVGGFILGALGAFVGIIVFAWGR